MGHNVSRARQTDRAHDQARAEAARWLVPGWAVDVDPPFRIQAIPTIMGAWLRGQVLVYRCLRSDCGRRVEPDLQGLVHAGFGHLKPGELREDLSCRHPLGCQLKLACETYPRGVPLITYVQQPDVLFAVACQGCGHTVSRTAADTIARLAASRRGDGSTGVNELASRVRGPCRRCGGRAFKSEVIRPSTQMGGP